MSLRARLTAAFVLVFALPLAAIALLVGGAVGGEVSARAASELRAAGAAAPAVYHAWQVRAADLVREAADGLSRPATSAAFVDPAAAARFATSSRGSLSFLAVVARDGRVLGISASEPRFLRGAAPPAGAEVVRDRPSPWAVIAEAVVTDPRGTGGVLVGGFWLDESFVASVAGSGSRTLVVVEGAAVASDDPRVREAFRPGLRADGPLLAGRVAGRDVVAVRGRLAEGSPAARLSLVTFTGRDDALGTASSLSNGLLAAVASAIVLGAVVAWMLARMITKPLGDMAATAQAIARGSLSGTLEVRSPDEVGRIASAFNEVLEVMQARLVDLQDSRDQVRRSVDRLGEVLRSTHDMSKMLSVVLETAVAATQARAGAVWLLAPSRAELSVKVSRGMQGETSDLRPRLGEGIAGEVARSRRPVLVPSGAETPAPASWEPHEPTVLAVPIESETQLIGVISLYGRTVPQPFDALDLETVRSLARQAAVGVENVLLHQEAQRLSITDGLTSLWNYRYMNMRLGQEVERAIRFRRAMSVLVIDIDHFKGINDRYGHQRGDAILAELANRVVGETRAQVDTVARYGGEEFVLLLPETPIEGGRVVAGKIRDSIAGVPFGSDGEEPIAVTVSIGLACFPQHGTTAQTLLRAADQALYEAKGRGRNCVVTADELDAASPSPVADDLERP